MKFLTFSQRAKEDREIFFKAQMIFHLLAATDGHGKGLIHPRRIKMAMALTGESGKKYNWDKILRRHWLNTARTSGFSQKRCEVLLDEIKGETPAVIQSVRQELPASFPANIAESIFTGMERHLTAL